ATSKSDNANRTRLRRIQTRLGGFDVSWKARIASTTKQARTAPRIENGSVNLQRNRPGSGTGIPTRRAFARKNRAVVQPSRNIKLSFLRRKITMRPATHSNP